PHTAAAETRRSRSPIPTQMVSNGEYNPLPQSRDQQRVEARIKEMADQLGRRHGMSRRSFLASSAGMAAAFLAMNEVFGSVFDVAPAEAAEPGVALARANAMSGQYIVDVQTHFVRDDFKQDVCSGWPSTPSRTGTRPSPTRTTSIATSSRTTSRKCSSTATRRWR